MLSQDFNQKITQINWLHDKETNLNNKRISVISDKSFEIQIKIYALENCYLHKRLLSRKYNKTFDQPAHY